jgi:mono/diheme cytochrome c family protein
MVAMGGAASGLSLFLLLLAGCDNAKPPENVASGPQGSSAGRTTSGPSGPGSGPGAGGPANAGGAAQSGKPGGPPGPKGAQLAANATGAEIIQKKCGCHGPDGKSGQAPSLAGGGGDSDAELFKVIHDGEGKMPAFKDQLTDDQIKLVIAHMKTIK